MAGKTIIPALAKADKTPYHHGDLRDALIRAAQEILEANGLAALSLRGVARCAGVSPAAPYHHFPDKQALLDAVAERGFDALTTAMTTRMDKVSGGAARLDASGIGYVAFAVANPALFGLMFSTVGQNPSAGTSLDSARQRAFAVLQEVVAACSPNRNADAAECLRLWALVHGIAKLVLEACVRPADFGLADGEALAAYLLRRPQPWNTRNEADKKAKAEILAEQTAMRAARSKARIAKPQAKQGGETKKMPLSGKAAAD